MKLIKDNVQLEVSFFYQRQNVWIPVPEEAYGERGICFENDEGRYCADFKENEDGFAWSMGFDAKYETQMKLRVAVPDRENIYHVIPCNIFGDNHAEEARPGEFPLLTEEHAEVSFCSPVWEYRADRASVPISGACFEGGCVFVSIAPYAEKIRNGLFAELPNAFGATLGYTNAPVTMSCKRTPTPSTADKAYQAQTQGQIYVQCGEDRRSIHQIVRRQYAALHRRAEYQKSWEEAIEGLLDTFCCMNYDAEAGEYTNRCCKPPKDMEMKPWRNVVEIGWTGGAVLAYPLVMARYLLGDRAKAPLSAAMSGEEIIDRITKGYNEKSGMFYDLMAPVDESGSRVNGWWTGFGLVKDCHCAYTVGSAVHYILKTVAFLRKHSADCPQEWLESCRKVLDTVLQLQRDDGALGYTYSQEERKVLDWSGFAGCWFAPSFAYLTMLTGEEKYLEAAKRSLRYYHQFVKDLNCFGTPMDTWKSIDEEGNLAFIRGCRLVHEYTGDPEFLEYLRDGADYECLWRYAYPTRPDFAPIKDGWNSCGGSVTSVSNPHIHPMGVIVDQDLYYLAEKSGDTYYAERAADSSAWMMQTLELYPDRTGYGQYGVLSERWCPSDGLTLERYSDGNAYSSWFSYNLWAAANVMEAACECFENGISIC